MFTAVTYIAGMSISDWSTLAGLIIAVATIIYGVKRVTIKWLSNELKSLREEVTPNGRDTQKMGDIVARTETKVDNLYEFMTRYAQKVDNLEKNVAYLEGLIESSLRNTHD